MAAWQAVLLLNLALAVGVGWGYVWWGRQAEQLARELVDFPSQLVPHLVEHRHSAKKESARRGDAGRGSKSRFPR